MTRLSIQYALLFVVLHDEGYWLLGSRSPWSCAQVDKEEVCTPLRSYQVQVYTREEKIMLIGNVRIVTSKMSCALVRERESCVVCCDTLRGKHKGRGERTFGSVATKM